MNRKETNSLQNDLSEKHSRPLQEFLNNPDYFKDSIDYIGDNSFPKMILDNISDAVFTFDKNVIITSWNKSAEKLYGWKAHEIIGRNSAEFFRTNSTPETIHKLISELDEKGELFFEPVHHTKDNREIFVEAHLISIKDNNGSIIGYLTVNRDITSRKLIENQRQHEKERLEILADLVGVFVKVTNDYTHALDYTVKKLANGLGDQCLIRLLNEKQDQLVESAFWHRDKECMEYIIGLYSSIFHQPDESFSGKTINNDKPLLIPVISDLSDMKPEYKEYVNRFGLASMVFVPIEAENMVLGTLSMYRNKPGNPFTIEDQLFLQNVAGKIGFAVSKANLFNSKLEEISERKLVEQKLKFALKEKEVLLKELYHRTKNNMQVVSSLLGIKKESIQEDSVKTILDELKNQILSISLVHQKLYQSKDLSNVDLKEYINDLVSLLMSSYTSSNKKVKVIFDLEHISVLIDTAIPIGLIINELITNSLKHAFPDDREGEISILLRKLEMDLLELKVADNGVGLPAEIDKLNSNTLGTHLLNTIIETQLNGSINIENKTGLAYTIRFHELYHERV